MTESLGDHGIAHEKKENQVLFGLGKDGSATSMQRIGGRKKLSSSSFHSFQHRRDMYSLLAGSRNRKSLPDICNEPRSSAPSQ